MEQHMVGRWYPNPNFRQIADHSLFYFVLENKMEQHMVGRRYQNPNFRQIAHHSLFLIDSGKRNGTTNGGQRRYPNHNFRQIAHHSLFYFVLETKWNNKWWADITKIIIFYQLPTIRCSISFCKTKWNNKWWAETVPKS